MSEIDKQLKTESVDRIQKLSEKLDLAKRASEMAAKEAELYAEKIEKLKKGHEDASKMTDKQKEQLLKLSEQMATAQQKANTYAAQVNELEKEYKENIDAAKNAENATENYSESLDDASEHVREMSNETKEGADSAENFFEKLKQGVAVNLISSGLQKIGSFFADIAAKAWGAAKAVASFAKEYAKEAINLAADYQDALGYADQVFKEHSKNVQKWVKDNSVRLRLNVSDLQAYVNNMGSLYRSFGFEQEKAAELAEGLINRAADLKSATGKDLQDVLDSLTSVLTGGYKAGYQYGIVINEATIKAKAFADGLVDLEVDQTKVNDAQLKLEKSAKKLSEAIKKHGEDSLEAREAEAALEKATTELNDALGGQAVALTQAQKEQAIYNLIMEQTAHIEGQSAREAGGYKSQLDALNTVFENLKINIGDKLLPVATDLLTKFNEFIESAEGQELLDSIVQSVGDLAGKVSEMVSDGRLEEWMNSLKEKVPEITADIKDFTDKVAELVPQIMDLTERILSLFGIETEAEKSRQAIFEHRTELDELAKTYNTSTETIITAIAAFAEENDLKMSEVVGDMSTYKSEIEDYLDGMKNKYSTNFESMWVTIADFAAKNGKSVKEICGDWEAYEPQIVSYAASMGDDYKTNFDESLANLRSFADDNDRELGEVLTAWQNNDIEIVDEMQQFVSNTASMEDAVIQEISQLGPDSQAAIDSAVSSVNTGSWDSFWRGVKQTASDVWSFISTVTSPSAWENSGFSLSGGVRDSGGPVRAGQMYRVNDDAGRRMEMFVPNVDGYILNGNDTQRVINNNTNNSRNYGDLIVNVNSYGSDAASIADEIGAAVNRKLRMAGSW
ncbi:MAG: hypothetical protein IJI14_12215 [Anaerolineaceae bacterium]|nr:hypothetical protein [Anaerolineaceae bacterium]